jgi:hypothetical protein
MEEAESCPPGIYSCIYDAREYPSDENVLDSLRFPEVLPVYIEETGEVIFHRLPPIRFIPQWLFDCMDTHVKAKCNCPLRHRQVAFLPLRNIMHVQEINDEVLKTLIEDETLRGKVKVGVEYLEDNLRARTFSNIRLILPSTLPKTAECLDRVKKVKHKLNPTTIIQMSSVLDQDMLEDILKMERNFTLGVIKEIVESERIDTW